MNVPFFAVEAYVPGGGGSRIGPNKIRKMPSGRYRYQNLLLQLRENSALTPHSEVLDRTRLHTSELKIFCLTGVVALHWSQAFSISITKAEGLLESSMCLMSILRSYRGHSKHH